MSAASASVSVSMSPSAVADLEAARRGDRHESGMVYLIRCRVTRRVKIGFTTNPPGARLAQLQPSSPTELELAWSGAGSRAVESGLHEACSAHRLHNEWFSPEAEAIFFLRYASALDAVGRATQLSERFPGCIERINAALAVA